MGMVNSLWCELVGVVERCCSNGLSGPGAAGWDLAEIGLGLYRRGPGDRSSRHSHFREAPTTAMSYVRTDKQIESIVSTLGISKRRIRRFNLRAVYFSGRDSDTCLLAVVKARAVDHVSVHKTPGKR